MEGTGRRSMGWGRDDIKVKVPSIQYVPLAITIITTSTIHRPDHTDTTHSFDKTFASIQPNQTIEMQFAYFLFAAPALVAATLDPATSNTKGACPSVYSCSATKVSKAIQAAECSHNTRTSKTQTFAVFETDHQYDGNNGAPYGTCSAYTCTPPTSSQMTSDEDCWTFFWR